MLSNITEIFYIYNVFSRVNRQLYFIFNRVLLIIHAEFVTQNSKKKLVRVSVTVEMTL